MFFKNQITADNFRIKKCCPCVPVSPLLSLCPRSGKFRLASLQLVQATRMRNVFSQSDCLFTYVTSQLKRIKDNS